MTHLKSPPSTTGLHADVEMPERVDAHTEPETLPSAGVRGILPRLGRGVAMGHHGEILQGVFEQPSGLLARGLVTLAARRLGSRAVFQPASHGGVVVEPSWKEKARRAAELTLTRLGQGCSGVLTVESRITPRWGFGSSTSDVVASVRAVTSAFRRCLPPEVVAEIAVRSETASDSTMFGQRAVLFAQRRGVVLEELGPALPCARVIGFNLDPTGWGVDTLIFPPARYSWWEIEAFRPLLGLLRRAVRERDATLLGQVASASARINQRHLPKRRFDDLERITEQCEGLGLQVAHSGCVAGVLLNDDAGWEERRQAVRRRLAEIGITSTWCLRVGAPSHEAP